MNLKERALRFIGTSPGIRFGSFGVPSFTKGLNIRPRRSIPNELVQRISSNPQQQNLEETISASQGLITNLGKITLNLEQTKNNLDRIVEVIQEDYKISKDQNKKEVEEYRKRIANRGRLFGKKEIADKKTGAGFDVKKYVGSFFSNSGPLKTLGALSLLNLFEAILSGDISKIVGPLLALVSVYVVPKVIGLILKQLGKRVLGSLFPRAIPRGAPLPGPAIPTRPSGSPGKFFGKAALLAGGLTLGSQLLGNQNQGDATEQRLEELTQEQKASVASSSLVPIPQDDLKKFEQLNKKFEEALDFLLKKQKEDSAKSQGSAGGGGSNSRITPTDTSGNFSGSTASQQAFTYFKSKGLSNEDSAAIVGNLLQENRSMDPTLTNSIGMKGIAQWDANRWAGLESFAASKGLDPNKRETQLQYVYYEFVTGKGGLGLERLKRTAGLEAKTKLVRTDYERPGESEAMDSRRLQYARDVMRLYSGVTPTGSPPAPVLPAPPGETYPSIGGYSSSNVSPIINLIPVTSTESTSMSGVDGNDQDIPAVDTFYAGNFLSFYSKLTYQIV